jgi:tight adherence protein C
LRFARAGIASPDAPIYYLFFQRIASFGFFTIGVVLVLTAKGDMTFQAIGGLIGLLGVFGPKLWLQNSIDRRAKLLLRAFPDTLDLLLICVESGLALDAALARVCGELARAYPEMTTELNRTRLELTLLNDRVRALMNLGDRTGMVAFRSLVVALIQSERFGTSLIDTLRVLSEDFRLQRLANAEAKAARLPVLMTIPLMLLLMPAFLLIVLGPSIVAFLHNT